MGECKKFFLPVQLTNVTHDFFSFRTINLRNPWTIRPAGGDRWICWRALYCSSWCNYMKSQIVIPQIWIKRGCWIIWVGDCLVDECIGALMKIFNMIIVASSMPRHKFNQILQYFHVADNKNLDKNDKMAKLRPLMKIFNRKFCETYMMDQNLDLDESMIEYFGRHGCKQCIRNKPIRFGFKAGSLSSPN